MRPILLAFIKVAPSQYLAEELQVQSKGLSYFLFRYSEENISHLWYLFIDNKEDGYLADTNELGLTLTTGEAVQWANMIMNGY